MKFITKALFKEHFHYQSEKSVEEFRHDLITLFKKTEGWNFSVNLTGEMTGKNEFKIVPKWQFLVTKGWFWDRSEAVIRGHIFEDEHGRAQIPFSIRPTYLLPIFFIVFLLLGVGGMLSCFADSNPDALIAGVGFLTFPVIIMLYAYFAKNALMNRFVRIFKLTPAPVPIGLDGKRLSG